MKVAAALAALIGVAACEDGVLEPHELELQNIRRISQVTYQEVPFAAGALHIVAPDGDRMRTYKLVPCHGGERICAGSAHGRAGTMLQGQEYLAVSGAYHNTTFYLSPGGDGFLRQGHREVPLAWATVTPH
ncbi:hypothetical protein OG2516_10296 [Oceanicola granulosus HTCC2516]|uniref:Lipoprotein n=2 Tax=Oceanicola granulosus TaxID=252302 RepID=Q2CKE4_OCEGH|nr:hypothetical protein OG2516_10296 [Oceanicola granulosus HTCC2516]